MTLAEQGKPEEAIEHWRRALRIDPGNVRTWCLLADHLVRLGRTEKAVNAYRRALQIDPNCAAAHHGLRLATGGDAPAGS
jgi:cytochrome c-type biogenesis protein CcmH/NrfG